MCGSSRGSINIVKVCRSLAYTSFFLCSTKTAHLGIMATLSTIHPPSFGTIFSFTTFYCNSSSRRSKKLKQRRQKQDPGNRGGAVSFPKSTPTPLLIPQKPYKETKFQALDAVIEDLEASVKNGIVVDSETYASLLETCYKLESIEHGIRIHRIIPANLLRKNSGISSKLLRLYASCGLIDNAHKVFDQMSRRDSSTFPWNSLISGYAELGQHEDALALYFQMEEEGVERDRFTFPRVLKACGGIRSIQVGEAVHRDIVRSGLAMDEFVLTALVDMYAKCGDIVKARKVFDQIAIKNLVSWNSMLTGYIRHGLLVEALDILREMIKDGVEPDSVALSTILSGVSSLKHGAQVHGWVLRQGQEWALPVANSLIVMYSNHGKLHQAQWLFGQMPEKDVVSWNSIINAHRKNPQALTYFNQMLSSGVSPDKITFVSILSTCAHLGLVKEGEMLFSMIRGRFGLNLIMEHYACMVNLYGKAGFIREAYDIVENKMDFEAGPTVWGALLYACFLHGNADIGEIAAEKLFDLEPDNEHNYELLMKIYGSAGRLDDVERVRTMMLEKGFDL